MLGGIVRPRAGTASHEWSPNTAYHHHRMLSSDEEHGKRDDDFRPRVQPVSPLSWILPWRWRSKRRLALVALVVLFLYGLFQHGSMERMPKMPDLSRLPDMSSFTSLERAPAQAPRLAPASRPATLPPKKETTGTLPPTDETSDVDHYFNGKVRHPRLASSLDKLGRAPFGAASGRVLFAASSLKSVANLMPLACEAGRVNKSEVHMAVLGRNALSIPEILSVNGFKQQDCHVMFHDGRADFAEYSTAKRAELSTLAAFKQINEFVNPQAIVVDGGKQEESFFTTAMRQRAEDYAKTLIAIPEKRYDDFLWMTRLDADSLENWFKPTIDILVQAPRKSSGSLIRLLKSLKTADYSGLKAPRLVVELPPVVEPFATQWLNGLTWPPSESEPVSQSNMLTLNHRISSRLLTGDQSALRFVESFYPSDPRFHHVLVLSSQAELSPLFFQYLYYSVLQYRHSEKWWEAGDIMGVSLDRPSTLIDGKSTLQAPTVNDMRESATVNAKAADPKANAPFLYQTSSLGATLVFGDKWATFHDFLQRRLEATQRDLAKPQKKLVSAGEPAWSEYLLELTRARGWSILHPADTLVTLHDELAQVPEEFLRPPPKSAKATPSKKSGSKASEEKQAFLSEDTNPTPKPQESTSEAQTSTSGKKPPLHKFLPFNGFLPDLGSLPWLAHTGKSHLRIAVNELTEQYLPVFRREIGGCTSANAIEAKKQEAAATALIGTTSDLFCLPEDFAIAQFMEADGPKQQVSSADDSGRSGRNSDDKDTSESSVAQQNVVLPGLEKQTFAMLDHPDVEIGMAIPPQRAEGGYGPKRPLLRGLEVVPPKGEE